DEFDSLGQIRDYDNKDNSEMKRVVNAIIQLMDYFPQKSILIAATNQVHMIDEALKRRFEWQVSYEKPSDELLDDLYDTLKIPIPEKYHPKKRLYQASYAQAKDDFYKQVKQNIINEQLS
ncbi:MAG: AAA family ATPase, partial [Myroides sp.]